MNLSAHSPLVIRNGLYKQMSCKDCDLLIHVPQSSEESLSCARCGAEVCRHIKPQAEASLALLLTTVIAFVIANVHHIVRIDSAGRQSSATLLQTVLILQQQDKLPVALLVLLTGIICPMVQLLSMLYIQLPLAFGHAPPNFEWLMRLKVMTHPWSMIEIFLMGNLIALVKLANVASVHIGPGLVALFALTFTMTFSRNQFNAEQLWVSYERCRHK